MPQSKVKVNNPAKPPGTAKVDSIDSSSSNSVENSVPLDANMSKIGSLIPSEVTLSLDDELVPVDVEVAQSSSQETSAIEVGVGGGPISGAQFTFVDSSATLEEVNRDDEKNSLPSQQFGKKDQVRKYVFAQLYSY